MNIEIKRFIQMCPKGRKIEIEKEGALIKIYIKDEEKKFNFEYDLNRINKDKSLVQVETGIECFPVIAIIKESEEKWHTSIPNWVCEE